VRVFSFFLSLSLSRARARAPPPHAIIALACLLFLFLRRAIVFRALCGVCVFLFTNFCASRSHLEPGFLVVFFLPGNCFLSNFLFFIFYFFGLDYATSGKEIRK
jgi:hypothetical protein